MKAKTSHAARRTAASGAARPGKRSLPPSPERLREICWDIGSRFPGAHAGHRLILVAHHPRQGYVHWSLEQGRIDALQARLGPRFCGARFILRVYDVTAIHFDGLNAHSFFDIDVRGLAGKAYVRIPEPERNLLAEVGFWLPDDSFWALARSNTCFFDRDRPSQAFDLGGQYVGPNFDPTFPLDSVLDAPVFERIGDRLAPSRRNPIRVVEVETGFGGTMGDFVRRLALRLGKFGVDCEHLTPRSTPATGLELQDAVEKQAQAVFERLRAEHACRPFDLVHCHDWYSALVGVRAAGSLGVPFVVTLHSTEHARAQGHPQGPLSEFILDWERRAATRASLVIVPHGGVEHVARDHYGVAADRVTVIADLAEEESPAPLDPGRTRGEVGLGPGSTVVLFAGELCHASGADILAEAIPTVCRDTDAHFLFAGDGPLRPELEACVWGAGVGHRCRFIGDVPGHRFEALLTAADFVVIPARCFQNTGLAELAISFGKPVLTTQQAHIPCVDHGRNGLVTHDNPGSIVWGIKELVRNPLRGHMLRLLAKRRAEQGPTLDAAAALHSVAFTRVLEDAGERVHA